MIDTAGPWEVFQDTMLDGALMHSHPFELYTVAPAVAMLKMTGGLQIVPPGLPATTHHDFWDRFAREFPDIDLKRGVRFVDNGRIATAGGLTSGLDMALHIVARYFGDEVAATTARYMEHASDAWRTGKGAAPAGTDAAAG